MRGEPAGPRHGPSAPAKAARARGPTEGRSTRRDENPRPPNTSPDQHHLFGESRSHVSASGNTLPWTRPAPRWSGPVGLGQTMIELVWPAGGPDQSATWSGPRLVVWTTPYLVWTRPLDQTRARGLIQLCSLAFLILRSGPPGRTGPAPLGWSIWKSGPPRASPANQLGWTNIPGLVQLRVVRSTPHGPDHLTGPYQELWFGTPSKLKLHFCTTRLSPSRRASDASTDTTIRLHSRRSGPCNFRCCPGLFDCDFEYKGLLVKIPK